MKSVTERLADKFGGAWEYDRALARWLGSNGCVVYRVHRGGFDENGEARIGTTYWLHEPGGNSYEITL